MLSAQQKELSVEERLDRAFRYDKNEEKRKEGDAVFQSYLLGGIEILYEKIMQGTEDTDDYLIKLYAFLDEYNGRYNAKIDNMDIYDLCKLASDWIYAQ